MKQEITMNKRLQKYKYYFSVEGETEYNYLEWLQNKINEIGSCRVDFDVRIEKSPLKRMRGLSIIQKTPIWHFCDYESSGKEHVLQFRNTIDEMRESEKHKDVEYYLGYSNFTFDLWIILHKKDCNDSKSHRKHYIGDINEAFHEHFRTLRQYKQKDDFKRCLSKLTIDDVKAAIRRAKVIMRNRKAVDTPIRYSDCCYYSNNPSLAVHEIIEKILMDCGLFRQRG